MPYYGGVEGAGAREGLSNASYQSSSATKFTALSRYAENRIICDTKSRIIALSISSTTNKRYITKRKKKGICYCT